MAYVSKEDKIKIVAAVKAVMPKTWKASFRVENASKIVCTVRQAPFNLKDVFVNLRSDFTGDYIDLSHARYNNVCKEKAFADILTAIRDALDTDNYDNSDVMTDYFDVGHYVGFQFGDWNKPFINNSK